MMMKTATATISYDASRERLVCKHENGFVDSIPYYEPISAGSDSWGIAGEFGTPVAVDHDGQFVHATYEVCETAEESEANIVANATLDADEIGHGIGRSEK